MNPCFSKKISKRTKDDIVKFKIDFCDLLILKKLIDSLSQKK